MIEVFDQRRCTLGEGPLWHPVRNQLFWFDILEKRLLTRVGDQEQVWHFDNHVSAAGWIDADHLMIADEKGLLRFSLANGVQQRLCEIEADNEVTRSNDGRADPLGGFWIGTMGKNAEKQAGAIYRYYKGELRCLFDKMTITNSICFAPDGMSAYFCDTRSRRIMRQAISEADGWPVGEPQVFVDLNVEGLNPDGSIVDATGALWNAQWGAARVARYDQNGRFLSALDLPAQQPTCPAFGGADLKTLFVTSAADGLDRAQHPEAGKTFSASPDVTGQPEHQIVL